MGHSCKLICDTLNKSKKINFYIFDSRDVDIESDLYKKVSMNIANKKMSEHDVYAFIWNNDYLFI